MAEIGYSICLNQRSKGFATAAVGALVDIALAAGVPRLVAHVDASNLASIVVLKRNGFDLGRSHREGKLGFGLRLAAMIN